MNNLRFAYDQHIFRFFDKFNYDQLVLKTLVFSFYFIKLSQFLLLDKF